MRAAEAVKSRTSEEAAATAAAAAAAAAGAAASASASSAAASPASTMGWERLRFNAKYRLVSPDELLAAVTSLSASLASRFDVPLGDAAAMLRVCSWDVARAEAAMSDADRREMLAKEAGARLFARPRPPFPAEEAAAGELQCGACWGDITAEEEAHALDCGHWFHTECWGDHCSARVDDGAALGVRCPEDGCDVLVDLAAVSEFLSGRRVPLFRTMVLNSVVQGTFAAACRDDRCDRFAAFADPTTRNVFCDCSAFFCFQCGKRGHGPCDCELAAVFTEKEEWVKDPDNGRIDAALKDKIKPW